MMTFVVDGNIIKAVSLLDDKRLGKQRVEAYQLIRILEGHQSSWKSHPALKMWIGYTDGLKYYFNCCVKEWTKRGKKNTMILYELPKKVVLPWWTQWDRLIYSHQAMLNRKEPSFYSFSVPEEYLGCGYIWPSTVTSDKLNAPLEEIAAELPAHLICPKYCSSILKSGKRAGEKCGRLLNVKQNEKCGVHAKSR